MTGRELVASMFEVLPEGEYRAQVVICRITRNAEGFEISNAIMLNTCTDFVVAPTPPTEEAPP